MIVGVHIQKKFMNTALEGEMWVQVGKNIMDEESSLNHSLLKLLRPRGARR